MKQLVRSYLQRMGYDIVPYPDPVSPKIDVLDLVLKNVAHLTPDFFFIQIGANNGVTGDPIHKYIVNYHWKGVLVEPQPDIFRELVANYASETQLIFENAAVASEDGICTLFAVDNPNPDSNWKGQETSLRKDHVAKHVSKGARIKELKVPALSVKTLISKYAITKIDLLQIDAEGYDYEIIKMFDLNQIKPKIINFEYSHINGIQRLECWKYLADWGYSLLTCGKDTLAFLENGSNLSES